MARPRKKSNAGLPSNLYYNKSNKCYRYRDPITKKWHNFEKDRQKAIKSAVILNEKLFQEKDLVEKVLVDHTVTMKQFIETFRQTIMSERKLSKATIDLYEIRHRQIINHLGAKPLNMIGLKDIDGFLGTLKPRSSNQARARLVDLFNHAVAKGLVESNIAGKTLIRNDEKQRKRHTKEGIKAIREKAPQWLKNAIDLALLISQRRCDLLNLRFDGIRDGYMYVVQQKTGESTDAGWLKFEITPEFQKVIDQCQDDVESPYLIHRKPDRRRKDKSKDHPTQITGHYLSAEFKKARDAAKCYPNYTPEQMPGMHEIRGTSLKMYQLAGKDAQKIAGHARPDMTMNYLKGHEYANWVEVSPDLDISEFKETLGKQ